MAEAAAARARPVTTPEQTPQFRRTPQQQTAQTPAVVSNPIYKIVTADDKAPEERSTLLRQELRFAETKLARQRAEELREVADHLQNVRKAISKKIIELTDTKVFGELQGVFGDMNGDLIDFNEKLDPLMKIVEAVNRLREQDKAVAAFLEIRKDKEAEAERATLLAEKQTQLTDLRDRITALQGEVDSLRTPRTVFGVSLGVSRGSEAAAKGKDRELEQAQTDLSNLITEIRGLQSPLEATSELGEFAADKDQLRQLLDLTSAEHETKQGEVVQAALDFVETSDTRIASVRDHLGALGKQIENLVDVNGKMEMVYAIMSDGVHGAAEDNQEIRVELTTPKDGEAALARMAREEKAAAVEEYLATLATIGQHTTSAHAELAAETVRVRTMKQGVTQEMDKARLMGTQGVAACAGHLSTVLQAVNSAALAETSAMAGDTMRKMIESTDRVAQSEVVRVAMGVQEAGQDVQRAIEGLRQYTTSVGTGIEITRTGVADMRNKLSELEQVAGELRDRVKESAGVAADAALPGEAIVEPVTQEQPVAADPFLSLDITEKAH